MAPLLIGIVVSCFCDAHCHLGKIKCFFPVKFQMPKGSDKSWCEKLYKSHDGKSKQFAKPRLSNTAFIVHHFADYVQYEVEGFLVKNRDTVIEEHLAVLRTSKVWHKYYRKDTCKDRHLIMMRPARCDIIMTRRLTVEISTLWTSNVQW